MIIKIKLYKNEQGKEPFNEWFDSIKDIQTMSRIDARLERLRLGNFGDFRNLRQGLIELRLHFGSGYRIYCGRDGRKVVVLLAGGDKGSQSKDIQNAQYYWADYKNN